MLEPPLSMIKNKMVVADDWRVLRLADGETAKTVDIEQRKIIVPLQVWRERHDSLHRRADVGVWLACDESLQDLIGNLGHFAVIAIDFRVFTDGRGYSLAFNLRARLGYRGELRAIGDVLRDQLFYLQRVGFDAFAPRQDRNINDALRGLSDFSERYQASWDTRLPLFKRVQRKGVSA